MASTPERAPRPHEPSEPRRRDPDSREALSSPPDGGPTEFGTQAFWIDDALAAADATVIDDPRSAPTVLQQPQGHAALFAGLPPEVTGLIESQMEERAFDAGEYLMRQGEPGDSLMALVEGCVEIHTDHAGTLARIDRPQVLGEMALLTGEPRSASVVARTPARARVLPAATFHALARQHPRISVVLTQLIARRLGRTDRGDVLAGKTFFGYRIRRRLGRGGMAVVYEADAEDGRRVALKMMNHRLVYDAAALQQFQREADIIESFDHPNVVRMYGRFDAFHTYFIVMQYCDGWTLEQLVDAHGPLPRAEVRKILGQTARALRYAHGLGIVHRDIKPSNIIVNHDGRVMLMDFGLAAPLSTADFLAEAPLAGTPRYMSPEQMEARPVGRASDLFGLGCVTYEMLTGLPLFEETEFFELLRRHAEWDLPRAEDEVPDLDPELREFIELCLRRNPEDRTVDLDRVAAWAGPVDKTLFLDSHAHGP